MLPRFARHYLLALQFFTRIPVTGALAAWVGYSPALLRASAAHFPGVGWLVGALAALVHAAWLALLPQGGYSPLLAAVLSTVATVLLTGGFHEDGLADVADGLGGGVTRERVLEIMKDSRVGAFGAMALMLALLAKVSLLAALGSVDVWLVCTGLWAGHVVSRTLPLLLIRVLPHVGDLAGSKSKPLAEQITPASLAVAALWCVGALALAAGVLEPVFLLASALLALGAWAWMWRLFARRLQGFTGDCLGATQQVCELAFYLGLVLSLGPAGGWLAP